MGGEDYTISFRLPKPSGGKHQQQADIYDPPRDEC